MDRRGFGRCCAAAALSPGATAWALTQFPPARLVHPDGSALKAADVTPDEALVFSYPYRGVPCYLIDLGDRAGTAMPLASSDDGDYTSPNGVGKNANLVAFVAICTHQLSYPTPEGSAIRYSADPSEMAGGLAGCIVCCAHGSVFDPAAGGQKLAGPAFGPLLPVRLSWDPATDELSATGAVGKNFFARFFDAFKTDLIERYGPGVYREEVGAATQAVPLSTYSKKVAVC